MLSQAVRALAVVCLEVLFTVSGRVGVRGGAECEASGVGDEVGQAGGRTTVAFFISSYLPSSAFILIV
jgi:hypothetical protein